jgi:hypothetical protein
MSTLLSSVPAMPGLYVVSVDCDDAPIDRDPRRNNPLRIGRAHCKFGRARNLAVRRSNYVKVFAGHDVEFKVIAVLEDINRAEAACVARLRRFRMRGPSGRAHEWLIDISPAEVEKIVQRVLLDGGFVFSSGSPSRNQAI